MVEVIDGIEHIGEMGIVGPVRGVIKWIGQLAGEKVHIIIFFEILLCGLKTP